jgi:hypothetical protein
VEGISTGEPAAFLGAADAGVRAAEPNGTKRGRDGKSADARVEKAIDRPPPPPPVATRVVQFRVVPWADIFVDGERVATGQMAQKELRHGTHVVQFRNPAAKPHEVRFEVTADGDATITARLEPRPAQLRVQATPADALVAVDGKVKTAAETLERPLMVAFGDGASSGKREVIVTKAGFQPTKQMVDFTAGETATLIVVLTAE